MCAHASASLLCCCIHLWRPCDICGQLHVRVVSLCPSRADCVCGGGAVQLELRDIYSVCSVHGKWRKPSGARCGQRGSGAVCAYSIPRKRVITCCSTLTRRRPRTPAKLIILLTRWRDAPRMRSSRCVNKGWVCNEWPDPRPACPPLNRMDVGWGWGRGAALYSVYRDSGRGFSTNLLMGGYLRVGRVEGIPSDAQLPVGTQLPRVYNKFCVCGSRLLPVAVG